MPFFPPLRKKGDMETVQLRRRGDNLGWQEVTVFVYFSLNINSDCSVVFFFLCEGDDYAPLYTLKHLSKW